MNSACLTFLSYPLKFLSKFKFIAFIIIFTLPLVKQTYAEFNPAKRGQVLDQIAYVTKIANEQPELALSKAQETLALAKDQYFENEEAELYRLIGLIWFYKVDYAKALDYFTKSHELYIKLGNKGGEASALNNISLVYGRQGYLDKTLEMGLQVLEMRKSLNDADKLAGSYNNIAVAYLDLENYDSALVYYKEAIAISISNNKTESLDLYYNNVGNLYMKTDLLDSAKHYFQKSLEISTELKHKQMMSNSNVYLGQYYLLKQNYNKAKEHLIKGLELAQDIAIVYEIEDAAKYLHEAFSKTGEYQKAYETHLMFKQMADSAKNLEAIQKITSIEADLKYKRERELNEVKQENLKLANQLEINKQKQARNLAILIGVILTLIIIFIYRSYIFKSNDNKALLIQKEEITLQKEEILAQRNRIKALNDTKDKFFAIIGHDLRNPLSGIYKLSEVVYTNFDFLERDKLKKYLLNIKTTSEGVYSLLDNLLKWASLQTGALSVNAHEFDIAKLIKQNKELLTSMAAQKNIQLSYSNGVNCLAFADEEMINTVLRNLMINAIKFTNDGGSISIDLERHDTSWKVCISDTGIGMTKEMQDVLFDLSPLSKNERKSKNSGVGLGLVLCKEFTQLNGGKIWVNSEINKGSKFCFTIPLSKDLKS